MHQNIVAEQKEGYTPEILGHDDKNMLIVRMPRSTYMTIFVTKKKTSTKNTKPLIQVTSCTAKESEDLDKLPSVQSLRKTVSSLFPGGK